MNSTESFEYTTRGERERGEEREIGVWYSLAPLKPALKFDITLAEVHGQSYNSGRLGALEL